MMKFGAFENVVQLLYSNVVPKPKSECNKTEQLGVSFAAGYIAGVFCAVVSQPADNLVSKLNSVKACLGWPLQLFHFPNLPAGFISFVASLRPKRHPPFCTCHKYKQLVNAASEP